MLRWIAEIAQEPLVLDPADRSREAEVNTWSLAPDPEERRTLSASDVVTAFERTAASVQSRVRALGFGGAATFYVWHDAQTGRLRCSTGSVAPDRLPFGVAYLPSDDLAAIIHDFLGDDAPGTVHWSDLDEVRSEAGQAVNGPEPEPLHVWTRSVGGVPH
ncbi:hypothetical protein [Nocardiopsis sp. Huas11]|uniref:hypothetical protein n=1 Tax=Nocardiopsis sp. Huas11 TaxID=2183912 RepID=UPI0018F53CBF|nr:hypothetical protein [Nocardiopsis sp. Huas11]